MTDAIPAVAHAVVCGSANWGLSFPADLDEPGVRLLGRNLAFDTPWGETTDWTLFELDGALTADAQPRRVLSVWSHGWPLDTIDHEAHRRVFWVLQQAGVRSVICCSTAGALNRGIFAGDFVIAADILELTQTRASLLPGRVAYDCSGKQMVCPRCAAAMAAAARAIWPAGARVYPIEAGLVAAHASGPRLTTRAEAAAYRSLGGDFINHSLAPEATLAREIGACFVNCSFITVAFENYAAPATASLLDEGVLPRLVPLASRAALRAIGNIDDAEPCLCAGLRSPQDPSHRARR